MIVDIDTDAPLLREQGSLKVYAVSNFDASLGDTHRFTPANATSAFAVEDGTGPSSPANYPDAFQIDIYGGEIIPGLRMHQFSIVFWGDGSMLSSDAVPTTIPEATLIHSDMTFVLLETGQDPVTDVYLNEVSAAPVIAPARVPVPAAAMVALFFALSFVAGMCQSGVRANADERIHRWTTTWL